MTNLNKIEEYRIYAESFSHTELAEAIHNVNKKTYPERHEVLQNVLSENFNGILPKLSTFKDRVKYHVRYIVIINSIFFLLGIARTLAAISKGTIDPFSTVQAVILPVLLFGLLRVKNWGRILTLACSYLQFSVMAVFAFIIPGSTTPILIAYIILSLICIYQIYILHRIETKEYFTSKIS